MYKASLWDHYFLQCVHHLWQGHCRAAGAWLTGHTRGGVVTERHFSCEVSSPKSKWQSRMIIPVCFTSSVDISVVPLISYFLFLLWKWNCLCANNKREAGWERHNAVQEEVLNSSLALLVVVDYLLWICHAQSFYFLLTEVWTELAYHQTSSSSCKGSCSVGSWWSACSQCQCVFPPWCRVHSPLHWQHTHSTATHHSLTCAPSFLQYQTYTFNPSTVTCTETVLFLCLLGKAQVKSQVSWDTSN